MKKIAVFQSDLRVGGIQKALINMLNDLNGDQCQVDLYLFEEGSFFDLPQHPNLNIIPRKPYPFLNRLVYFNILRRMAPVPVRDVEYDIAVDFNSYRNECSVGAVCARAKKRIMWIHNDVEIKKRNEPKYQILWHFFHKKLRHFDAFCAVSPGIIEGFRRTSGIWDKPITAIPNHIDTGEIFRKRDMPIDFAPDPGEFNLCTMGRICHQKGFDILLELVAQAVRRRPELHLYILGDGPDREKILAQARHLGIPDRVTLLGNQPNPFPYLAKMDAFTLTSRYEGQGLVIWEAKAVGLPLYIAKNLEKYNPGIAGTEDLVEAFVSAQRVPLRPDDLAQYNQEISRSLLQVLELDGEPAPEGDTILSD